MRAPLLALALALAPVPPVHAEDGAAPPPPAPVADGRTWDLVANAAAVDPATFELRSARALFRGLIATNTRHDPVTVYLPPPHAPSLEGVLSDVMGWTEATLERNRSQIEMQHHRPVFVRVVGTEELLARLLADPGGVGVVPVGTPLPAGLVRLVVPIAVKK